MDAKGLLTGNYDAINRGMLSGGINPFTGYQIGQNKFSTPYQFPGVSDSNYFGGGISTLDQGFSQLHDTTNGFGLKYGNGGGGTGYEPSSMGAQTHYGPPAIHAHVGEKGGKLKGAALSALTLLAFLFFLNLLQSCLKDQMDVMNPSVINYLFLVFYLFNYVLIFFFIQKKR